ncbi:MAG: DUF2339 domain-containing protein [Hyphomonadaceae bacterium]|nr:DUF2339 domain-containing protein [Hyphomonadaceae bacterium]
MELWVLAFLPLGVWVWLLAQRIDGLARRVAELELQLFTLRSTSPSAGQPQDSGSPAPPSAPSEELLLTEVVPDDVLVLDNPLPEASNDTSEPATPQPAAPAPAASPPRMHSPLLLDDPIMESPEAETRPLPPPKPQAPPKRLDQWLAENGLAWIAGIALSMGAIYLVAVAAQSAWFTPTVRLVAALVLGAALLGASEWTRRIGITRPPGHPLMSALLAGAGVVVFYTTTWAAHGLYHFIDWPGGAALLMLCALALIGLSLMHGQALGVLAIGLALLAPAIASSTIWPSWALALYVAIVSAGGFALAFFKRWSWAALTTVLGLYFWFFASIAIDDVRRALIFASIASIGGVLAAFRAPLADESKERLSWSAVSSLGPSIAISISSALLVWAWLAVAPIVSGMIAGPALISIFHVALASYSVRERHAAPVTLAVAVAALTISFVAFLRARVAIGPLGPDFYPTILLAAFSCVICALFANPHRTGRILIAAAGATGAAVLTLLAAFSRVDWHAVAAWLPLFAASLLSFAAAWYAEKSAQDRKTDVAVAWWAGAGAALVLLGVESSFPAEARALGHAAATLLFVAGFVWRGWRVTAWSTLTGAALTIAQALSPSLINPILSGVFPLWAGLLILLGAAVLLFGGSTIVRRSNANTLVAEALSAATAITLLVGLFVALRWIAAGGAGLALDGFTETSLRVLALLAAGLILLPRIHETPGFIGAWRGHALLGLGLLYALTVPGILLNPWWGGPGRAVVNGMPIVNALALAFAASAALAFWAAIRLYARQRTAARAYAIAGGALSLIWLIMEIRHAFHSGSMASPEIGLFEAACFALAFLGLALAFTVVARVRARKNPHRPFTEDLMHSMRSVSWGGIGASALIVLALQHPIWGTHDSASSNAFSTMLAVLAQAVAIVLALALGRALSVSRTAEPTRFAAASAAVLFAWSFGHSAIRWLHHRGYMDDGAAPYALEGLAHALWPLILVITGAVLTRFAPGRDTTRAYLYDLQSIWSAAIWPALGFAGLGMWALFNPWWGAWPAHLISGAGAFMALLAYGAAAALSYVAPDVPHVRGMKWMVPTATIACATHIFVAATLIVRWAYHGADMATARPGEIELWIYSGIWAVLATAALALGAVRNDPVLRWIGLAIFAITIAKVFFIDTAQLSGVIRAGSFIALGAIAAASTWMSRRNRPPPSPGDLVTVTPSARRERRRVRRRNSP